jgi:nucleoside-diphosphate-sugar epimerase
MTSLVTGASGFLGSHIVERLLARGEQVRALVRPTSDTRFLRDVGAELATGDVTDPESLHRALDGVDTVYHAAAYVSDWGPWSRFREVTVRGTANMLRAAADAGVKRFLHVSTDGVYALRALSRGVTEDAPLERRFGWLDYYRRSKAEAERLARRYGAEGRLPVTIIRPALIIGERDGSMLPGIAAFLRSKNAVCIGSGENRLPCVYAGDVAEAAILAAANENAAGRVYNVVSDEHVTQRTLFEAVARATGVPPPRRSLPVPLVYALAFGMEAWCVLVRRRRVRPELTRFAVVLLAYDYQEDATRARNELGWRPLVGMNEAVRRYVEWSEARQEAPAGG